MMTALDVALADVYLDEMYRRGLSHTEMRARTDIPDRTWRNYFGSRRTGTPPRNAMPAGVTYIIAEAMGALAWELMKAAQERVAAAPAEPDWIEDTLSPSKRRVVERSRAAHGVEKAKDAPPPALKRRRRSA